MLGLPMAYLVAEDEVIAAILALSRMSRKERVRALRALIEARPPSAQD